MILSQILRGMAQGLEDKEDFNSVEFAAALKQGSAVAYQAVIKPAKKGDLMNQLRYCWRESRRKEESSHQVEGDRDYAYLVNREED